MNAPPRATQGVSCLGDVHRDTQVSLHRNRRWCKKTLNSYNWIFLVFKFSHSLINSSYLLSSLLFNFMLYLWRGSSFLEESSLILFSFFFLGVTHLRSVMDHNVIIDQQRQINNFHILYEKNNFHIYFYCPNLFIYLLYFTNWKKKLIKHGTYIYIYIRVWWLKRIVWGSWM